jgi:hypothetical protein
MRLHGEKRRRKWRACCSRASSSLGTNWRCWLASESLKVMSLSAMDVVRLDAIEESIPGRALLWRAFFGPTRTQLRMVRKGTPC